MKFSIDIMWLNNRCNTISIEHNLKPWTCCTTYGPTSRNAVYVLETVAGFSKKHKVQVGTNVGLHLI